MKIGCRCGTCARVSGRAVGASEGRFARATKGRGWPGCMPLGHRRSPTPATPRSDARSRRGIDTASRDGNRGVGLRRALIIAETSVAVFDTLVCVGPWAATSAPHLYIDEVPVILDSPLYRADVTPMKVQSIRAVKYPRRVFRE